MKSWTILTVLAVLTSSCNCQSGFEFEIALTCDEIADGAYNSQFSQKSPSGLGQLFNLNLVINDVSGYCDPDPLVNVVFSLTESRSKVLTRHDTPKTNWGARTECERMSGTLAEREDLTIWRTSLANLTYVDDNAHPYYMLGKNCAALSKSDWRVVRIDCAEKLPFFCVK